MVDNKRVDSDNRRRENDINYFEELKELHAKIDKYMQEEVQRHLETAEKLSSVEANLETMKDYVKKVTDILERITAVEERNKSHNHIIGEITALVKTVEKQITADKTNTDKSIAALSEKVNKWNYSIAGAFAVLTVLWAIFSNGIETKFNNVNELLERMKIHLEVDKPAGWPPTIPNNIQGSQAKNRN